MLLFGELRENGICLNLSSYVPPVPCHFFSLSIRPFIP